MSTPAEQDIEALPGTVRVRELFRRLFRADIVGPLIVVLITIAGGVAGIRISPPTWPLAALGVGGVATAFWRILVGDRSHAAEMVMWRHDVLSRQWSAATGIPEPIAIDAVRAWIGSKAFASAPPADRAEALLRTGDVEQARGLLDGAHGRDAVERANLAATRFDLEYAVRGEADSSQWRDAVARLDADNARVHRASMAIYEAATDVVEHRPWLITLDKAARELGPFPMPPRRRLLRRLYPIVPVVLGMAIVGMSYWLLAPMLAA